LSDLCPDDKQHGLDIYESRVETVETEVLEK